MKARRGLALLPGAALAILLCGYAYAAGAPIRIGVGSQGPISPQTMYQVEQVVGEIPGVKVVPIVPPGEMVACVRRFVAGERDDQLDGLVVVSLPPDSFKVERDSREASFSGSYDIYTLDLSTLAEDRHKFMFSDSEPVTGGMAAILAIPADLPGACSEQDALLEKQTRISPVADTPGKCVRFGPTGPSRAILENLVDAARAVRARTLLMSCKS